MENRHQNQFMPRSETNMSRKEHPSLNCCGVAFFSVSSLCVIVLETFYKFPNQNFKAVGLNLPS